MSNLTDFKKYELYPALFNRIDQVFPNRDFRLRGNVWGSPYKLNGEKRSRWDKTYIRSIAPNRIAENGEDSSGVELIDFYMSENSLDFVGAMEALCKIAGLQLPQMEDSESYRAYKEKQERLEKIASRMEAALYTDEGAATLSYLRESRGYSDEFIKWAGFGFVSPSFEAELRELFKDGTRYPSGLGEDFTLSITYRTSGTIQGFQFRTIDKNRGQDKYRLLFISKNAAKKYYLFGLTGVNLTGNRERDRDITIVEGEIDALRAINAGLDNVVAASGGEVSAEALSEAQRRGVKRVTLLYDTGEDGTDKKIEKAITTINEAGLTPFVATFPSDGGKVDTDSYLRDHSGDELREIVEIALPAPLWMSNRLLLKATEGKSEGLTHKELEVLRGKIIDLANSPYTSPTYRDIILRDFNQCTGDYITQSALLEEANKEKAAQDELRQRQETIELTGKALKLAQDGRAAEALSLIQDRAKELQQISREAENNELLTNPTTEMIKDSLKQRPTGVATGYIFENRNGMKEELILPSGALTYICAPTSHGKSRFLENLALNLATNGEEGDVLYFSFEEDSVAIQMQFLNIYVNMNLSANNSRTLSGYFRDGTTQYISKAVRVADFQQRVEEFLHILTSGKLRVYYRDYDSSELMEAIRYVAKRIKVKAVFIDYIQLLHTNGTRLQRREELGEMCKDFWGLATELSLPIVLAAQLNREVVSPLDMTSQNIAEAADIERSANTILLLWNSSFKPTPQKSSYYRSKDGDSLTEEAKKLESRGFNIGTDGKIYAKISKNRGGSPNMDAILDFNGNTGKISQNLDQAEARADNKENSLDF